MAYQDPRNDMAETHPILLGYQLWDAGSSDDEDEDTHSPWISIGYKSPEILAEWTIDTPAVMQHTSARWREIARAPRKASFEMVFLGRQYPRGIGGDKFGLYGEPTGRVIFTVDRPDNNASGVVRFSLPKAECAPVFEAIADALDRLDRTGAEQYRKLAPL